MWVCEPLDGGTRIGRTKLFGIKVTYVPFKGTGDLVSSVAGGHVSGAMSYLPFAIQPAQRTAAKRRLLPTLTSITRSGGVDSNVWPSRPTVRADTISARPRRPRRRATTVQRQLA